MRILFPYLARWHSANRTRYHHLLTALARRGHRVLVLQAPPHPSARETNYRDMPGSEVPGLEVRDIPVPDALWTPTVPLDKLWKKGVTTLAARRSIRAAIRDDRIEVLLLYNVPQIAFVKAGAPVLAVDVADDLLAMLEHEAGPAAGAVLPLARAAWKRVLDAASVVTAASPALAASVGPRATVLSNGVDPDAAARADGRAIRARHPGPLVGYVGTFEYFVNLDLIVDLARRLAGSCTFLLVGGGRDWARMREKAAGFGLHHVHFTGPVPYAEALDHMAALNIALMPFRAGPVADAACPLKLFEYLAVGRPVIASPDAEVRRLASDWIRFAGSPEDWELRIRELLRNPLHASAELTRARAAIGMRHTWDRITGCLENLLVTALEARHR